MIEKNRIDKSGLFIRFFFNQKATDRQLDFLKTLYRRWQKYGAQTHINVSGTSQVFISEVFINGNGVWHHHYFKVVNLGNSNFRGPGVKFEKSKVREIKSLKSSGKFNSNHFGPIIVDKNIKFKILSLVNNFQILQLKKYVLKHFWKSKTIKAPAVLRVK